MIPKQRLPWSRQRRDRVLMTLLVVSLLLALVNAYGTSVGWYCP